MFKDKYSKDNEMLSAPESSRVKIMNMITQNKTNRQNLIRPSIIAAACLLIAAVAAITFVLAPGGSNPAVPPVEVVSLGDLVIAEDYSEIFERIEQINTRYYGNAFDMAVGAITDDAVPESSISAGGLKESYNSSDNFLSTDSIAPDHSETNTQVKGVDEADIIKTDGHYIYRISNSEIVIIDPHKMSVVSRIQPFTGKDNWLIDMYVKDERLAVTYGKFVTDADGYYSESRTGVMVYDISDRSAPTLTGDFTQSGHIVSSRLIGDYLYLISSYNISHAPDKNQPETYVPTLESNGDLCVMSPEDICLLPDPNFSSYTIIGSVNILDGSSFESAQAAFGCSCTVYADAETILLAFSVTENETIDTQEDGQNVNITTSTSHTKIVRYNISGGNAAIAAQGTVPGTLLNQFSIDRYKDIIRVVTTNNVWTQKIYTDGVDRYEHESTSTNGLYTLDGKLQQLGAIEGLAEDERVYSVRFSGDIGYFVTFRQVDPLFAADLSDPSSPRLLSALKIPGFSQYLHPYADGLLFGLGMDADEETGAAGSLKLSMFDVSDPANVSERHKLIMNDITWSEALYDHKAAIISAERNIIAFPTNSGYTICGYSDSGFNVRFSLNPENFSGYNSRGVFIGDYFFICTSNTLYRYSISDFTELGSLKFGSDENSYYFMIDALC